MNKSFVNFNRSWLLQNLSGLLVAMFIVVFRFIGQDPQAGAVEILLRIFIPCLLLIGTLPAVIYFLNRRDAFDVPSDSEAPPGMWNMARLSSIVLILSNVVLAVGSASAADYAEYSLLPIVLSGWIGINIGNLLHYRRSA